MPARPAFIGRRLAFLTGEKPRYYSGVKDGIGRDILKDIQRRFLLRFDIDLPSDKEPSDEFLSSVDDSKPAPEYPLPDFDEASEELYEEQTKLWKARQKRLVRRKQVSRMEVLMKGEWLTFD